MAGKLSRMKNHRLRDLARINVQSQMKELAQELHLQGLTILQLEIQMDAIAECLERAGRLGKITKEGIREEIRKQINIRTEKAKEAKAREQARSESGAASKDAEQTLAPTIGGGSDSGTRPKAGGTRMAG